MKYKYLILFLLILFLFSVYFFIQKKETPLTTHRTPEQSSIIILSPHFDDAVFSLGGLLSQKRNSATVITFFTKENNEVQTTYWDEISGFKDSLEATNQRTKENIEALGIFSSNIKNYKFDNFQYNENRDEEELINKLTQTLEKIISDIEGEVFIYGPMIFDKKTIHVHPDHYVLYISIINVFNKNKNPNISFFLYEDYPYIEKSKFSTKDVINFLEKNSDVKLNAEYIYLNKENLNTKIDAMKKYSSQINAFNFLNEDLLSGVYKFNKSRCNLLKLYACEIVYRIN